MRRLKWPKPHQLVLVVGALVAIFTLVSGYVPRLTEWSEHSKISRESFIDVPDAVYWAFYVTAATMLFICAWLVSLRVRNYQRGAPDDRRTTKKNLHRRMRDFRAGVWMQTLLRDPAAGIMHSLIYFGFMWLFIATVVLEIDHQLPDNLKFLHGGDLRGLRVRRRPRRRRLHRRHRVGDRPALHRAAVPHPHQDQARRRGDPRHVPRDRAHRLLHRGVAHRARSAVPSFEKWSFIGYPLSSLFDSWSIGALQNAHRSLWIVHFAAFVAFLVILPTTKLRHMITSPMNMYLKASDRPKGAMKPMPNLMETDLETFGASTVEDFTWKQLFDTDACTVCGRCTSVCPAHATGKPLDPREIVLKVGEVMAATGDPVVSPPVGVRARHHDHRQLGVRAGHVGRAVGVHVVQGVRRDLPGEHRDPRQDPRHAALPVADGERLPGRARQHVPRDGELVERVRHEPGRARRLGRVARGRRDRRSRFGPARARVPLLDRLRGLVRRPQQEDESRRREAAAARRHRLRDPRAERALHRRPGATLGQRVHLPDAGDAEHRVARRPRRAEDHHAVPALLQHAEERVPAARRELRGRAPLAAARAARRRRPARRWRARRSTSASRTTTPATSAVTTTSTSRRAT